MNKIIKKLSLSTLIILSIAVISLSVFLNIKPDNYTQQSINPNNKTQTFETNKTINNQQITDDRYSQLKSNMLFTQNNGQLPKKIKFASHAAGYSVYFDNQAPTIVMNEYASQISPKTTNQNSDINQEEKSIQQPALLASYQLSYQLENANMSKAIGQDKLESKSFTYKKSATAIQSEHFAKVRYNEVYNKIDVVYYGNQGRLEHDFIVHPGAKTSDIKINIQGADQLKINANGDLNIN